MVTGTEGGRLEFWCLASSQRITYVDAFESQVTTFQVSLMSQWPSVFGDPLGHNKTFLLMLMHWNVIEFQFSII